MLSRLPCMPDKLKAYSPVSSRGSLLRLAAPSQPQHLLMGLSFLLPTTIKQMVWNGGGCSRHLRTCSSSKIGSHMP